jgi:hypothetical protein
MQPGHGGRGFHGPLERRHQPTAPSIWSSISRLSSSAYSIGSSRAIGSTKPRTMVAARWVLEAQAGAPWDAVAEVLEAGADFHFAVHNAAGMVSVQEGISVTEALIRLRAFAFSSDRLLADVAEDVLARRLRLG